MVTKYITFSIAIAFISWIVGMAVTSVFIKTPYYAKLANVIILTNEKQGKLIGLAAFKWIVKNTPFKFFNPKLQLKTTTDIAALQTLKKEMTFAEISHLVGFLFVCGFAVVKIVEGYYAHALVILLVDIIMNLYPSLLQQENKRRINKLIKVLDYKVKRAS